MRLENLVLHGITKVSEDCYIDCSLASCTLPPLQFIPDSVTVAGIEDDDLQSDHSKVECVHPEANVVWRAFLTGRWSSW